MKPIKCHGLNPSMFSSVLLGKGPKSLTWFTKLAKPGSNNISIAIYPFPLPTLSCENKILSSQALHILASRLSCTALPWLATLWPHVAEPNLLFRFQFRSFTALCHPQCTKPKTDDSPKCHQNILYFNGVFAVFTMTATWLSHILTRL